MLECPERVLSNYCDLKQIIKDCSQYIQENALDVSMQRQERKGIDNLALFFGKSFVTAHKHYLEFHEN